MASTKQAQVVITANATIAKKVMDELKSKAKQCYDQMQQLAQAGQQNSKAFKAAEKEFNAYNNAIAHNVSPMKRVSEVVKDLANTSMRDLKRALGAATRELSNFSENSDAVKVGELRKNIDLITAQMDKLSGKALDVEKGMRDLSQQSDEWIKRAIQQQDALFAKSTKGSYERMRSSFLLSDLKREQMNRAVAQAARPDATIDNLRAARSVVSTARDAGQYIGQDIARSNQLISEIDKRLDALQGKGRRLEMTLEDIEKMSIDPKSFTPEELSRGIDNLNTQLRKLKMSDPARGPLESQLKTLQNTLKGVDGKRKAEDVDRSKNARYRTRYVAMWNPKSGETHRPAIMMELRHLQERIRNYLVDFYGYEGEVAILDTFADANIDMGSL